MTSKPLLALLGLFALAAVHPEGELTIDPTTFSPGLTVHLTGKKFPKNEMIDVLLAGPAKRTSLKQIKTDAEGAFHEFVVVPDNLPPGAYRVVLIALSDDDEVASVDVQMTAGGGAPVTAASPAAEHASHMASAEPLVLARARSPLVTGSAFALIAIAIAIGAMAVLRPRGA